LQLADVTPRVWRRLRMSGALPLADLHRAIQVLFGWGDYHLHVFEVGGREYGPRTDADADEDEPSDRPRDDAEITTEEALAMAGGRIGYVYDFGDEWRLAITATAGGESAPPLPECVGGERAGPPEDFGGPGAYQELLEAWGLAGGGLPASIRETLPRGFDATAFDVETVNLRLAEQFRGDAPRGDLLSDADDQLLADVTLLLLLLGSWPERNGKHVASRALRLDVLDALSDAGYVVANPHRKTVTLTEHGVRRAEAIRARVATLLHGPPR
jgi:hypothetical protein